MKVLAETIYTVGGEEVCTLRMLFYPLKYKDVRMSIRTATND